MPISNTNFESITKEIGEYTIVVFTAYGNVLNIKCYHDPYLNAEHV
jgi:hypothetical protein